MAFICPLVLFFKTSAVTWALSRVLYRYRNLEAVLKILNVVLLLFTFVLTLKHKLMPRKTLKPTLSFQDVHRGLY